MNGFLTFILVILFLWYGGKLFFKYALPWLILHLLNKQQEKYKQGFNHDTRKKEGEVEIQVEKPEQPKTHDQDFGEYVDFEEVKPDEEPKDE